MVPPWLHSLPFLSPRRLWFLLGIALTGLSLGAMAAPWFFWVGTLLVLLYLTWTGHRGILLASLWATGLITFAVLTRTFPRFWNPQTHYQYWALTVLLVWALMTGFIVLARRRGQEPAPDPTAYPQRTATYYLARMDPTIRASLSPAPQQAVTAALTEAIPKPTPKLVSLPLEVDLLVEQFLLSCLWVRIAAASLGSMARMGSTE